MITDEQREVFGSGLNGGDVAAARGGGGFTRTWESDGTGLSGLSFEKFRTRFEAMGASLAKPFEGDANWDLESFRQAVSDNLNAGNFRLVIAVDALHPALKHTLEFLMDRQPTGLTLSWHEFGGAAFTVGKRDRRRNLLEQIGARSGAAAVNTADALLDWADEQKPHLEVDIGRVDAVVGTRSGTLFRIVRFSEVRVSVDKIKLQLEGRHDQMSEKIEQGLDKIGVPTEGKKARAPLASLSTETFLELMTQALAALMNSHQQKPLR